MISDDHPGLVKAIDEQLLGSAWQRCRVHFTRNAQDLVPRSGRSMVASAIRLVIEQPDGMSAREQLDRVIDGFRPRFPAVAELLTRAEPVVCMRSPVTYAAVRVVHPPRDLRGKWVDPNHVEVDLDPEPGSIAGQGAHAGAVDLV